MQVPKDLFTSSCIKFSSYVNKMFFKYLNLKSLDAEPLDVIINENPDFINANFLKIYTDGSDFLVLVVPKEYIRVYIRQLYWKAILQRKLMSNRLLRL